jgi:PhzF family phenazine biosynthesis protein
MDRDLMMIMDKEEVIKNMKVDQAKLQELEGVCIAVTAKSEHPEYDSVSRVFAPELNIPEDPVTGSTHCMIAPFWAKRLGKDELVCYQASERTGVLYAKVNGDRVKISGKAVLYSTSELEV